MSTSDAIGAHDVIARAVILILLCVLPGAGFANPVDELKANAIVILKAQSELDRGSVSGFGLDAEIAALTRLINGTELDESGLTTARYYRGRAAVLINQVRLKNKQKTDAELARRALADYDWVIERGRDVPPMRVTVANAAYSAGEAARTFLDALPLAYAYWEKCARREHAGCLYLMASAKITGQGGIKIDVPGALELHRKVYDSGIDFSCAGAFSALATAQIIYFSGTAQLTVGDLDWLKRADLLLDQLATERKWSSPCKRTRFKIAEYLIRLERGEDRRSLLESASALAGEAEEKATAGYLLGGVSEAAFRDTAAKGADKDAVCEMHFAALWYAEIRKDAERSQNHYRSMSGLGPNHCAMEIALAKMKYRR